MENNMNDKYKLTDETKTLFDGTVLHRIEALTSGPWGPAGTIGGWVESEWNLSQEGKCWIYGDLISSGKNVISGNSALGFPEEDEEELQLEDFCNLDTEDKVSNTTERNTTESNTEVEAFVGTVGLGLFKFMVIALAILLAGAAVWFVLQSVYALIVLVLSLISLFRAA